MPFKLIDLAVDHPALGRDPAPIRRLLEHHWAATAPRRRLSRSYYENPLRYQPIGDDRNGSDRPYRQAQEWGLPSRLTGRHAGGTPFTGEPSERARKEIVIENDIAWRVDTQVDFLVGKGVMLDSAAPDPARRETIATLLRLVLAQNGGMGLLRDLATRAAVHGFADVVVHGDRAAADQPGRLPPPDGTACDLAQFGHRSAGTPNTGVDFDPDADGTVPGLDRLAQIARAVRLELVDPERALPITDPEDPACLRCFAATWPKPGPGDVPEDADAVDVPRGSWVRRLLASLGHESAADRPVRGEGNRPVVVHLLSPARWQRYEDERLVAEGQNPLGRLPVVRWRNTPRPGHYGGAGEVEPLIPLQDELNARLSDRANRLTMTSFKMYLGIGIDGFEELPIRPGQMWATDNPDARILEFGGDTPAPTEDAHVREVREALDKASGVSPIAAGAIRGRIGRLTSAAALRVTLLALLAKTERKRLHHGAAVGQVCELALAWLDHFGLFKTDPRERGVRLHWPSPIPADQADDLAAAKAKLDLGVDPAVVRRELGY